MKSCYKFAFVMDFGVFSILTSSFEKGILPVKIYHCRMITSALCNGMERLNEKE